jgi:hypothetical protein
VTRDEFLRRYASNSGAPAEYILEQRTAIPCECREDGCDGWQMVPRELADDPMVARWGRGDVTDVPPSWREYPDWGP